MIIFLILYSAVALICVIAFLIASVILAKNDTEGKAGIHIAVASIVIGIVLFVSIIVIFSMDWSSMSFKFTEINLFPGLK
ncbi:hypothetical protein AUK11_00185 [bacterium CG2_30_37_16]|nr:MAG: hypothetical protein AUK11_00185 [bacterium CG2_30_37_16]PIP30639.1 MAG: hypothetical protein COX25_03550 [bacterium (Candidatus Howlettbacteria) CG23_combo_of_CG06-09_8_20_14_all_37_9]PIY00065.1 MAG: hypothetical protein COZ22_01200 [bacterium (Candidatus Howlettbacteria) CG_4_10_14_3_um_filter_37_10]PJB05383.1 MAG: hypothetical protein CO123_04175 [bacterium (Candidatus Howlettbacteria) CG_4_9_14_3_um_filter_37_10]